ncbi:MAG: matrixin family metalloprotease, partial [Planktomarina sp.]
MTDIAPELGDVLDSGREISNPTNITVYFYGAGETWTENGTTYTSNGWSADEITQAMDALQQFSNVANLTFTQTTDESTATFSLGTYNIGSNILGYFYLPGNYDEAGIGAFDDTLDSWDAQSLQSGGFSYTLLLHEFGHGLGLSHPHA